MQMQPYTTQARHNTETETTSYQQLVCYGLSHFLFFLLSFSLDRVRTAPRNQQGMACQMHHQPHLAQAATDRFLLMSHSSTLVEP